MTEKTIRNIEIIVAIAVISLFLYGYSILVDYIKNNEVKVVKNITPSYDELKSYTVLLYRYEEVDKNKDGKKTTEKVGQGTGSVINITDEYTYILTNRHVCDSKASACSAYDENDNEYFLELVKESSVQDLAVWKYLGKIPEKQKIKGISCVNIQDKVYFVGNYMGFGYIYGEGTVAGRNENKDLFLQLPGMSGDSGSAIFNDKSELIAITYTMNIAPTTAIYIGSIVSSHINCIDGESIKIFIYDILSL